MTHKIGFEFVAFFSFQKEGVMERLKIGEVAERTGLSRQSIRYYEREGLIEKPYRSPTSGYRKFEPEVVYRIRFIQNAQELGFTLEQIKDLLDILEKRKEVPGKFATKLASKKNEIEERIEKLTAIKYVLEELIEECPEEGTVQDCPCVKEIAPEGHLKEFLKPFESRL